MPKKFEPTTETVDNDPTRRVQSMLKDLSGSWLLMMYFFLYHTFNEGDRIFMDAFILPELYRRELLGPLDDPNYGGEFGVNYVNLHRIYKLGHQSVFQELARQLFHVTDDDPFSLTRRFIECILGAEWDEHEKQFNFYEGCGPEGRKTGETTETTTP